MNSTFTKKACGQISDKAQRNLVAAELEAHISDKADYYRELGYDEETSLDKAIEDMGDPEEIWYWFCCTLPYIFITGG